VSDFKVPSRLDTKWKATIALMRQELRFMSLAKRDRISSTCGMKQFPGSDETVFMTA
jgi:hypothetical protein